MGVRVVDTELFNYQKNKNSAGLILRHHDLISRLARLCKGTHRDPDPFFRWFYGLFLEARPRTVMNILDARDRIVAGTALLTHEDCYNQITVFLLEMAKSYERKYRSERKRLGSHAPEQDFSHYVRMVLGWRVKNWLSTVLLRSETTLSPGLLSSHEDYQDEDVELFTLDLSWVINGSSNPLFRTLRPYDRYILFLYFTEDQTIAEIAFTTYQSKNTVNGDLHNIIQKCRRAAKE